MQGPLLGLIGLMFVIYFGQAIFGPGWYQNLMAVPGEVVASWDALRTGSFSPVIWREFGTLLSCAFLHGSIEHVTFNILYFWIFGALLAELLGWRWMLVIFFVTAIGASATHVVLNREEFIPMLGASGALMGFEGAYLGLAVRWSLPDPHVWPMSRSIPPGQLALLAVIGVIFDYTAILGGVDAGIAYGAHVGGFTTGLLMAALVVPKPRMAGLRR
ncbi:MAG TPA: rhomboid family intramembrane serine protease [Luteolibacter sp.]|nr:rhomboid family intramembrane serine protease [Luteolibacter sp.]